MQPVHALRLAVFVTAALYMQAGPALKTGLGQRAPWFTTPWRMYHSRGLDQCKMEVFHTPPGGERREVDWVALLGRPWHEAPHIGEHADIRRYVPTLCRALEGQVNVVTTCAASRGYKRPSLTAGLDVCSLPKMGR